MSLASQLRAPFSVGFLVSRRASCEWSLTACVLGIMISACCISGVLGEQGLGAGPGPPRPPRHTVAAPVPGHPRPWVPEAVSAVAAVPAHGWPLVVCVCSAGLSSWCGVCLPHPALGTRCPGGQSCVSAGRADCTPVAALSLPRASLVWRELSWLLVRGLQRPTLLLPGLCTRACPLDRVALVSSWCLEPCRHPGSQRLLVTFKLLWGLLSCSALCPKDSVHPFS